MYEIKLIDIKVGIKENIYGCNGSQQSQSTIVYFCSLYKTYITINLQNILLADITETLVLLTIGQIVLKRITITQ